MTATAIALAPEPRPPTPILLTEETQTPTLAQRTAGHRAATLASRIGRATCSAFMTPHSRAQASTDRRELERVCVELRKAGV